MCAKSNLLVEGEGLSGYGGTLLAIAPMDVITTVDQAWHLLEPRTGWSLRTSLTTSPQHTLRPPGLPSQTCDSLPAAPQQPLSMPSQPPVVAVLASSASPQTLPSTLTQSSPECTTAIPEDPLGASGSKENTPANTQHLSMSSAEVCISTNSQHLPLASVA